MFNNVYKGKKVLVTGNTGFKGSWLTVWLLHLGADVYGMSSGIFTEPSMFEQLDLKSKITHYDHDIRDLDTTISMFNTIKPDFVFHLAAQAIVSESYEDPIYTLSTNVMGTANVLESIKQMDTTCVAVMITSDKCYENIEQIWGYKETDRLGGSDPYSASKACAEMVIYSYYTSFLKNSGSVIASARAGNVIGGGDWAKDRIIPDCIRSWKNKEAVEIRSPDATRPWQHVLEPLSGYLMLGLRLNNRSGLNGRSYNFGPSSKNPYTVLDMIKNLSEYFHDPAYKFSSDPIKFHECTLLKLNCDKALEDLKWYSNLDYMETIDFTGSWYSEYIEENDDMYQFTKDQLNSYVTKARMRGILWTK